MAENCDSKGVPIQTNPNPVVGCIPQQNFPNLSPLIFVLFLLIDAILGILDDFRVYYIRVIIHIPFISLYHLYLTVGCKFL